MQIGELSKRTGVSRRSLRYYEKRGLLYAKRNGTGWREYDESAVARVENVRDLLAVGLRVRDIHRISPPCLQHDLMQTPVCDEAINMFAKRLAEVDADIATLQRHRDGLAVRLAELQHRRLAEQHYHETTHPTQETVGTTR